MTTETGSFLKGLRTRVTRLDAAGAPVIGSCSFVVTEGFVQATVGLETEQGTEYLQKNAQGGFCINQKDSPRYKWANLGFDWCLVHPDILDMVANAEPVVNATDTIGVQYTEAPSTAKFAIETWGEKAGSADRWLYSVAPYVVNGILDGDHTFEDGPLTMQTLGEGFAQPAGAPWGEGPHGDNPYLVAGGVPEGVMLAEIITTVAPPAVTAGCQPLA